jgi:plastocyanin
MKHLIKFALIACITALVPLSAKAATVQVQVGAGGLKFTPANVMIQVGDTVQWTWVGAQLHSTTSGTPGNPDGMWDSGLHNNGFTFSFTFTQAGTFNYFCSPHGTCCNMIGSVIVTEAIDTVTINKATWSSSQMLLTVTATDSNPSAVLTCTRTSDGFVFGMLRTRGDGNYQGKFRNVTTNPANITVTSNLGGSASANVRARP